MKYHIKDFDLARLTRARAIVRSGVVSIDSSGEFATIAGTADEPYTVTAEFCTCLDFQRHEERCKHIMAYLLEAGLVDDPVITMSTEALLEELAELQAAQQLTQMDKDAAIASVLTPAIKAALADIDLEFGEMLDPLDERINELRGHVKESVVATGESVKHAGLHAVYAKGRVSWDTKGLNDYATDHPEIEQFRKAGNPSCSIRNAA